MKVCGVSAISAGFRMTKKLTRIEPHSSLRRLVTCASTTWPPMSKRSTSPSFRFRVLASPARPRLRACGRPATCRPPPGCCGGSAVMVDRLNSRSTRRFRPVFDVGFAGDRRVVHLDQPAPYHRVQHRAARRRSATSVAASGACCSGWMFSTKLVRAHPAASPAARPAPGRRAPPSAAAGPSGPATARPPAPRLRRAGAAAR